jgi:hypothetical protein
VSFVIADNGYMGLLSLTWLDFTTPATMADIDGERSADASSIQPVFS